MAQSRTRKWIKRIILSLLGLIVIVFIAAYIILITHRKQILASITDTFNSKLSGRLTIRDMDFTIFDRFPSFTIRIEDVSVTDSASAVRGDTMLVAGKISIGIDLPKLFIGSIQFNSIRVSDASIYLVKYPNGKMNTPKPKKVNTQMAEQKKETSIPTMRKIFLQNVSFQMIDSVKNKSFGLKFIKTEFKSFSGDQEMSYHLNGSIHFAGLVFNPVKGGYLTNQDVQISAAIGFDPATKSLAVNDGILSIKQQKLKMSAEMDFGKKTMKMRFDSKSILPAVAIGVLTPVISQKLSAFQLEKPVMVQVMIAGLMTPGSKPAVDVYFKTAGNKLNVATRSFEELELLGWFTNHIDSTRINDDHNSRVALPVFKGKVYGLPIESKVLVTDLIEPRLLMKASLRCDEKQQGEITTQRFKFFHGMFDIEYLFDGPLVNYVDTINKVMIGDLSGEILFKGADFDQLSTGYQFRNVNGHLTFKKPDLIIDSIQMAMNGNKVKLTGSAKYFIAFIFIPSVKAQANLNLTADTIDFNSFQPPPQAKEEKKLANKESKKEADLPSLIDWIASSFEFNINLSADKVMYKRFMATDIKANVVLGNDLLQINDAAMSTSGGNFLLNLSLTNLSARQHELHLKSSIKGVRINDLMYSFDNFSQQAVTNKNITGTLTSFATFKASIDKNYHVIGSTMQGNLSTKIKNGSLQNMEALEKISQYIFKNRDFSDIQFADIRNHATLNGTELDIDTLNIFSSVITLFMSGNYDFNKKNTDLLVTVPFSNLKKMDASERMALSDSAARKGGNVSLRATNGNDGSLKISPVIFGKKKKKDKS